MKITCEKIVNTKFDNLINSDNTMYCEIKYNRDKSSFAGIAFEVSGSKELAVDERKEELYEKVNKYENIYIGLDNVYCDSIKEVYEYIRPNIGFIIHFLVYSDVKSSQIVFEQLTKWILENYSKL